ncbi:MAG TPA: hypothetical protein VFC61_02405 [Blastocatellia bacterium]|nr:hypothetical protein [Blastocatellia bacterium]
MGGCRQVWGRGGLGRLLWGAGPAEVVRGAVRAVPAVKYALGVAGVSAAAALAAGVAGDWGRALAGAAVMLLLMTALALFARLSSLAARDLRPALLLLVWCALLLTVATAALLLASVFFGRPLDLHHWLAGG